MLKLFGAQPVPAPPAQQVPALTPKLAFSIKSLRDSWWELFASLIINSCTEDVDSLLKSGDRAAQITKAARELADAAIYEYEERWASLARDEAGYDAGNDQD